MSIIQLASREHFRIHGEGDAIPTATVCLSTGWTSPWTKYISCILASCSYSTYHTSFVATVHAILTMLASVATAHARLTMLASVATVHARLTML